MVPLFFIMKEIFAIFGKRPIPGFAKTRLEKSLGSKKTQELYHVFMKEFFASLNLDMEIHLFGTPREAQTEIYFKKLIKRPFNFYFQSELPFFERLREVFKTFDDTFVHLTGTDIPDFPFEIIDEVNAVSGKVYIGPDQGGGFYYLGAHSSHRDLFSLELESGADNVLEKIIHQAQSMGLEVILLKEWSDIDEIDDLNAYYLRKKLPPL
ncbi:MAG: hypothetical protein E2O68_05160 [Deltaproteobacteria bacterium]|nr:MAG: hypothetical protein E2O68_05160 [Deltaproteobacteria bacterium]